MKRLKIENADSLQNGLNGRSPRMSPNDKGILLRLLPKYVDVIECKKTDAITNKMKIDCWKKITEEFCSSSQIARTCQQLQNFYKNSRIRTWPKTTVKITDSDNFNVQDICRLCLTTDVGMERVFEHDGEEIVVEQIFRMTTVRVTSVDDFEILICKSCKKFINHWQRFKDQCIENDRAFNEKCSSSPKTTSNFSIEFEEIFLGDDKSKIKKLPDLENEEEKLNIRIEESILKEEPFSQEIPDEPNELLLLVSEIKVEDPTIQLLEDIEPNAPIKLDEVFEKVEMSEPVAPDELHESKLTVTKKRFKKVRPAVASSLEKKIICSKNKLNATKEKLCVICGAFVIQMSEHLKAHKGIKRYACPVCNKMFYHNSVMKTHLNFHTREKMHKCDYENCHKEYPGADGLRTHKETHLKDKKHACKECGKKLTHRTGLVEHMKIHLPRHIPCPHCTRVYNTKDGLRKHIVIHSDEKPFECHHCAMAYKWKSNLRHHIVAKHRKSKID